MALVWCSRTKAPELGGAEGNTDTHTRQGQQHVAMSFLMKEADHTEVGLYSTDYKLPATCGLMQDDSCNN